MFLGDILNTANAASSGLEIPSVHLRFHDFTALAGTPMRRCIGLNICKNVLVTVGRAKFVIAVGAIESLPFLCVLVCGVRNDVCFPGAGSAFSPMAGIICKIDILVSNGNCTLVAADITDLITVGCENMFRRICSFSAFGADLPVVSFIVNFFAGSFMTAFQHITTVFARLGATIRELVFLMADTTTAVGAACPVVNTVMIPVCAQCVLRSSLFVTFIADLLMVFFIDIGKVAVDMDSGSVDFLGRSGIAVRTGNFLAAAFFAGGFFQHFAVFPIVVFSLLQITFGANPAMLTVVHILPAAVLMVTGILNTSLASIICDCAAGVGFLLALGADLILFMRVV